ncbi:sensor histidine kinase [Rufibacter sediminis]|uniref:Sensor histidine kinase n=1 Tax=Rufibacter sediminis TaxID=2762756 RepID=A0ABR6W003_9BACT|nr:sensor histidine kinase [Rufibacter sediminis]MBC3542121.1 sensor histidine kinase [Rufibacter sediminis]
MANSQKLPISTSIKSAGKSAGDFRFSGFGNTFRNKLPHLAGRLSSLTASLEMALWQYIKKHRVVLAHLGVWLGFLGMWALTSVSFKLSALGLLGMCVTFLPAAFAFYGSNFLLFRYLPGQQYRKLILAEVLFFVGCFVVLVFTIHVWRPLAFQDEVMWPTLRTFTAWAYWRDSLWLYVLLSALSLGYYYLRQTGKKTRELKLTLQQKLEAEKGKLEAEYAFLRAQINPHFLHNTLNFFYAKSLGHSDELSDGILTLCDIMRYSLESDEDQNGTVLLTKEVEHLRNVIKINQLRFSHRLQIDFQLRGELHGLRIIPLVLITMVENAFKHGELTNAAHPLRFTLEVDAQNQLFFTVANKKRSGPKETSHGIGLDNTRKRLAAAYPNRHLLEVQDQEDFYTIALQIQLPAVAQPSTNVHVSAVPAAFSN